MEAISESMLKTLHALPPPQTCRLIDFDTAEVRPGIVNGTWFLAVRGETACANMRVELIPLIYVRRPDFWEIEVVGCLRQPVCVAQAKPFTEVLALNGTVGVKGIEVVGATRRQRIELP